MSFAVALDAVRGRPDDPEILADLARSALREGEEQQALDFLNAALPQSGPARLWQWKGLLHRSLDEHEEALEAFNAAARLAPTDAGIAHGLARVALEAGLPAENLFVRAQRLAPGDGSVLLGLAAARLAAGRGEQAEAELDSLLNRAPFWIEGHAQLAQLRSMLGRGGLTRSLERALSEHSKHKALWQALFDLRVKTEQFGALEEDIAKAHRVDADVALLLLYEAIAASELERTERADALFSQIETSGGRKLPIWRVRHLLRTGRAAEALPIIDRELSGAVAADIWPYAALTWRVSGDARYEWLDRSGSLVSTIDLKSELPPIERLADVLRSIHKAKGEYLDQSVRGGTQTDGPLFSRVEPEIQALRAAIVRAVERYVAQLPAPVAGHPTLSPPRDRRVRFAGSWSVRLRDNGFHASHVHPQGWISSALYVALPKTDVQGDPNAGWLQLAEPRPELRLELGPKQRIEPQLARLVLFPSWMWHGTAPFPAGERLTVAFDVAPPR